MSQYCKNDTCLFIQDTDELHQPFGTRSDEYNRTLFNATNDFTYAVAESFDTCSFQLIIDSSASSTATPCKDDFIKGTYEQTHGLTISSVAS